MLVTQALCSRISYSPDGRVTFVYCRPEQKFTFLEGQFMMLEILGHTRLDGKALKNSYSIATTSHMLQEQGEIGFVVKKASDDGVSDFLTTKTKIWDALQLTWPLGHMGDTAPTDRYLLVSVGSGVSPMVALYTRLVHEQIQGQSAIRVANLFGESYWSSVVPEVATLFREENPQVENFFFISRDEAVEAGCRQGHVQDGLDEALAFLGPVPGIQVLLCGKPEMVKQMEDLLIAKGFDKSQLKSEKY